METIKNFVQLEPSLSVLPLITSPRTFIKRATFNYLSLGSLFQIIPQNQSIAVPQPNANIISLMRVVGAWKEATPTKERTRQNAKPCMVPENCRRALNPVNIGDRTVTTNAS